MLYSFSKSVVILYNLIRLLKFLHFLQTEFTIILKACREQLKFNINLTLLNMSSNRDNLVRFTLPLAAANQRRKSKKYSSVIGCNRR